MPETVECEWCERKWTYPSRSLAALIAVGHAYLNHYQQLREEYGGGSD